MKPLKYKGRKQVIDEYKQLVDMNYELALADDCRNGHCDFSITGSISIYERWKKDGDSYIGLGREDLGFSGAVGDRISDYIPEFNIIEELHGKSSLGMPMYPTTNGFYFLKCKQYDIVKKDYGLSDDEIKEIQEICISDRHFGYILKKKGVLDRWKQKADEGIKFLEELTGEKFEDYTKEEIEKMRDDPERRCIRNEELFVFSEEEEEHFKSIDKKKAAEIKEAELNEKKLKRKEKFENEYKGKIEWAKMERDHQQWLIDNLKTNNYRYFFYHGEGKVTLNDVIGEEVLDENQIKEIMTMELPEGMVIKVKEKR